jgi:alpha-glucosidase
MTPFGKAQLIAQTPSSLSLQLAQGQFSVYALSETLLRVAYQPKHGYREPRTWAIAPINDQATADVPWQGRERAELTHLATASCQIKTSDHAVQLSTTAVTINIDLNELRLTWQTPSGQVILADRPTTAYLSSRRTGATCHYLARDLNDRYYGLGDKTGPLDQHGRRLRTMALDALGYDPERGDPLYKHWPFQLVRTAQGLWYGLYYDTLATCTFDLGCEHDNYHDRYRSISIEDGDLDYYVMLGKTPAEIISQFMRLIGGTHLPPRWTLGFAQTAMGLADAPNAEARLHQFIDEIAQHQVPCSAFHFGSGYSSRGKRRYVFTWNHDKFPNPKALNARFHAAGIQIVANLKPCLLDDHPAYAELAQSGGLINNSDSGQPVLEPFWDGMGSHLDFTHPPTIAWWQAQLKAQVLDYGIDVGWNDNNEYALVEDAAQSAGFGQALPMHRSRSLHPLLMTRATFETQRQGPPEQHFTVTRGGSPGIQRYAQTWSGDNTTSWESLRWNIRTGLQMSLSGMFNTGHDVGGFAGPSPTPELFLRWVQACCLNPRMVMNSWKTTGEINLPWMHPEVKDAVIAAIRLRYTLLPYLWSLFERATSRHEPIIRPTFYDFPEDEACYADGDEFMLGANLLVAPVVFAGQITRDVYLPQLPAGKDWVDFHTGQRYVSGQRHTVEAPLACLPLFAVSGSEIPLAETNGLPRFNDPISRVYRP